MERGSITKWLLFGLAIYLLLTVGKPLLFPSKAAPNQPRIEDETAAVAAGHDGGDPHTPGPSDRAPAETCTIEGPRFTAELSTQGASLRHVFLKDKAYTRPSQMPADTLGSILHLVTGDGKGSSEPADLVSTSRAGRSPLRVDLRVPGHVGGVPRAPTRPRSRSPTTTSTGSSRRATKIAAPSPTTTPPLR